MRVTPFATFDAAFPDDSVEEGGDIVAPAGQNIMRAIRASLVARGYQATIVDQHSHYGWSFNLRGNEGGFWLLVQCPGPWLLTVHDSRMIWSRFFRGRRRFFELIEQCRGCLASIPQVTSVSWMSQAEYESEFHGKKPSHKHA